MERRNKKDEAVVTSYRSCPTAPTKEIDRTQEDLLRVKGRGREKRGSQITQMKTIDDSFRPAAKCSRTWSHARIH